MLSLFLVTLTFPLVNTPLSLYRYLVCRVRTSTLMARFLSPHLMLILTCIFYILLGSLMFQSLEGQHFIVRFLKNIKFLNVKCNLWYKTQRKTKFVS